ncbi:hypothetical protein DY000_02008416 [Brassica cretica]|uniref:Uncharacterized protein n=1 Tax=Brassica cretica TaxID=69181 RepID=A0ABQ7CJ49_BRACR|nr:hypothetical protein DY000_02008416 [Brassica cretica]
MYVYIVMSRDYVSGRGSRDVWTSDAALVGGGSETSGLATQIVWGVGAETFAFDAALEGGGTETDCTSDATYASCLFMLELNFHSGSSIYSSQWFACLASHTSRSNSPVTHPSYSFPFQMRLTSKSDCYRAGVLGLVCKLVGIAFGLGCDNLRCVILELRLVCLPVSGGVDRCGDVSVWTFDIRHWEIFIFTVVYQLCMGGVKLFRDSSEMELCFAISFLGWTCYHDIEYCWIA